MVGLLLWAMLAIGLVGVVLMVMAGTARD